MPEYIPRPVNLEQRVQLRLIYQYRNSPKMKAWLSVLPVIGESDISEPAQRVAGLINIDSATGEALNICGRIAQIDRPVIPEPRLEDLTYLTALEDNPSQLGDDQSQLISLDSAIPVDLQDDVYRRLIRAKIAVNTSRATIQGIIEVMAQVVGFTPQDVRLYDYQDMTYEVFFLKPLNPIIRFVLSNYPVTPRPQGVKLLGYIEEPEYMQLGAEYQMGDNSSQLTSIYV